MHSVVADSAKTIQAPTCTIVLARACAHFTKVPASTCTCQGVLSCVVVHGLQASHAKVMVTAQLQATYFSSDSQAAIVPIHGSVETSSQFNDLQNCQLSTQVITVAVILCKYSR